MGTPFTAETLVYRSALKLTYQHVRIQHYPGVVPLNHLGGKERAAPAPTPYAFGSVMW